MPRGIKKYRGPFGAMPGPLYNTEGEAGGGGAATKTDDPKPKPPAAQTPASDEELGEGGKKALEREREARKLLERQLQGMQSQMAAIAQAFGVKPDDSDDGGQLVETFSSRSRRCSTRACRPRRPFTDHRGRRPRVPGVRQGRGADGPVRGTPERCRSSGHAQA